MRILFFAPQKLWPVNSGSRLRNVHLASALAERCSVTLLQVLQPGEQRDDPPGGPRFEDLLIARKRRSYTPGMVVKGIAGPLPVTVVNYESQDVADCLRTVLEARRFDSVQMETSNLFSYLDIIRAAPGRPSVLLDWHNIDSELMARYATEAGSLPKRWIARRTANLLLKLERRLLGLCDAHTVVSERDKSALLEHNPRARVTVIPNGVDAAAFVSPEGSSRRTSLLFVGSMDYHANADAVLWFAKEVWPAIASRFPDLKFTVAGRSPGREVKQLASDKIQVTGTVDDVRPFYAEARAVIVPLRVGSGTRLKILEAMAMGVPVISTTLGAEGITATNGIDILLADSAGAITDSVGKLLSDPALHGQLARAARKLVSEHYDWRKIGDRLYQAHQELLASRTKE